MTQELSSLMDGELDTPQAERAIRSCCASEDLKQNWYLYHAIGDAMRGQPPRKLALPDDMLESLKTQPTVLAPRRPLQGSFARIAMAAAASVATVGAVGWLWSQGAMVGGSAGPVVAKTTSGIQPVANKVTVQPTMDVQDYLAAHRQVPSPELYRAVNNHAPAPAR